MSGSSEQGTTSAWSITRKNIQEQLNIPDDEIDGEDEDDHITDSGFLPTRMSVIATDFSDAMLESLANVTVTTPIDQAPPGFPTQTSNLGTERGVELAALRYRKAETAAQRTAAAERLGFHRDAASSKDNTELVNTIDFVLDASNRVDQLREMIKSSWADEVRDTTEFCATLNESQLGSGPLKEEMEEYAKSKHRDYGMVQSLPGTTPHELYERKINAQAWEESFNEHWSKRTLP
ncbi:hypothetical protein IAR50_005747 [Cryptococcus sp. DSM 104548]